MKMTDKSVKTALVTAAIGSGTSLLLAIIKTYVGLSTNSVCIMLDGANSYMDIVSGVIAIVAFAYLLKPKNDVAPCGYGRGEYLAGLSTTVLCLVFGGLFLLESINRLAMPQPVWFGLQSTILIIVAFVLKLGLAVFYFIIYKRVKFKAIAALYLDSLLDLGVTAASFISLTVSSKISFAADAYFGLVISIVVILSAIGGIGQNTKNLLGVNPKINAEHKRVITEICRQNGVSVRSISLHDYGYSGVYGTLTLAYSTSVANAETFDSLCKALSEQNYFLQIILNSKAADV